MEGSTPVRVVILYVHPLLGEGLAKLLAAEPGIATAAISSGDAIETAAALTSRPDVVIVESGDGTVSPAASVDVAVPLLLFVGIGGAAGVRAVGSMTDDLERVVRAVRDLKRARMTLLSA